MYLENALFLRLSKSIFRVPQDTELKTNAFLNLSDESYSVLYSYLSNETKVVTIGSKILKNLKQFFKMDLIFFYSLKDKSKMADGLA